MDLTIDVENYKLNVRAAGVIVHNNKILVHRNLNSNHYALVGGRVEIGEDSENTVKREIQEELGKEVEITGYIATIENFFEADGSKYHEILFIHKAEFINEKDREIEKNLKNIEGKDYLQYEWLDLDKINEYPLLPKAVQKILKEKKFPVHKINKDIKQKESYSYIGNNVEVIIDRKLGSKHPKHGFVYTVNYGYVPNTVSGDGEELDCYVLGIDEAIEEFKGKCIAVIHRLNDDDDKLIIVPEEKNFTDDEIIELTNFQEQYFESEIIRQNINKTI